MNTLFKNEFVSIEYNEAEDLLYNTWGKCQSAEGYISTIKEYKAIFEKILPRRILWSEIDFDFVIPPDLQDWTYYFLDKPASDLNIDFQLGHILSNELLTSLPIIEMFPEGRTYYHPRFFVHEKQALDWIINQSLTSNDLRLSINKQEENKRAQIILDVNLDNLPEYLMEFQKLLKSRHFLAENRRKYELLSIREKEILKLVTHNYSNKEMADQLFLSIETVKTHRKNIHRKLQCKSISELMSYIVFD